MPANDVTDQNQYLYFQSICLANIQEQKELLLLAHKSVQASPTKAIIWPKDRNRSLFS